MRGHDYGLDGGLDDVLLRDAHALGPEGAREAPPQDTGRRGVGSGPGPALPHPAAARTALTSREDGQARCQVTRTRPL